jgi:hypothetical protein
MTSFAGVNKQVITLPLRFVISAIIIAMVNDMRYRLNIKKIERDFKAVGERWQQVQ